MPLQEDQECALFAQLDLAEALGTMRPLLIGIARAFLLSAMAYVFLKPAVPTPTRRTVFNAPIYLKNRLPTSAVAAKIVAAAHREVEDGALYTPGYIRIPYPNGDLPRDRGVCTDVVIRALRGAGYDLQKLIHEDVVRHFKAYPRREEHPDTNIDHRRVPNQMFFYRRFGLSLTTKTDTANRGEWRPGDIVYWKLDNGLDHAGIVSDTLGPSGLPMVIHNLEKCREEDVLGSWRIQGHFRFPRA